MNLFKSALLTAGVVALTLTSACVSHKPPPPIIHADNYTAESTKDQLAIPPADRILGLDEAIRIALTNNPTYKQKHLAIVTAWAAFYSALSAYSPQVSMAFGAAQTQTNGVRPLSAVSTPWSGGINASWNVFNGFQTTFSVLAARSTALSAEELDRDYRRQLIYMVTTAYNAILYSRAKIQIDLSDEAFNEQQLKDAQLKYNAGASSLATLLNFKANTASAQDAVITDTASYKVQRYALAALMGLTTADLPEETQFPPIEVAENEEYSLNVEFYLDLAIAQRPDLKSARLALDSLRYTLYSTWGAFSPTVDLAMNYGYNTGTNGNGNWGSSRVAPRGSDLNYNYGFGVAWNVWQGGQRIANVRTAQANLDIQEEALMSTWISVVQDVRTAYTNLIANETHRKIRAKIMEYRMQRRNLVKEEYNAGNTDITNLNQAQNYLVAAEGSHIQSVIDVANSRAELNSACGTNVLR